MFKWIILVIYFLVVLVFFIYEAKDTIKRFGYLTVGKAINHFLFSLFWIVIPIFFIVFFFFLILEKCLFYPIIKIFHFSKIKLLIKNLMDKRIIDKEKSFVI